MKLAAGDSEHDPESGNDPSLTPLAGGDEALKGRVDWDTEKLLRRIGRELPGFLPDVTITIEDIATGGKVTWHLRPSGVPDQDQAP